MTVRELIKTLLESDDMDAEVEIIANNGIEYDEFDISHLDEQQTISGPNELNIHFHLEDSQIVDKSEYENLIDEKEDIEEKNEELLERVDDLTNEIEELEAMK